MIADFHPGSSSSNILDRPITEFTE